MPAHPSSNPAPLLPSTFGGFTDHGRAYTLQSAGTPMPWCNVISNGRYGLVISQNGGGFSFYDDAQHNVLTRWEMDLVRDDRGKFLYLSDLDSGKVWTAAPAPRQAAYEEYRCTHGLGFTTFVTRYDGIEVTWTISVDPTDPVEVWHVQVKNTSGKARRLRLCSYLEWCCGVAPDAKREFHRLFFHTHYDVQRRAAIAGKVMWDIPPKNEKQHWNQPWPYKAAHAVHFPFEKAIAVGDKGTFLGRYGTTASPRVLREVPAGADGPSGAQFGRFGDAIAALGGDLTLAPEASTSGHWLLTIAHSESALTSLLDAYRDGAKAARTATAAQEAWVTRLARTSVETQAPDVDLLNNYWLPYQAISGRLWGRTGYYQQSGAFGFRDQLQDSQVWLPIDPAQTRKQILLHMTRQFKDGSVNHWWHALADFGNHTACSDDYLWLAFLTANYIKETGDWAILNETAPFRDDATPATPSTLQEHCRRSMERLWQRRSARGIPHIGSCDWNDGLSAMGVEERGESVWLSWFGAGILADWATIYDHLGVPASAAQCRERRQALIDAANAHAWDGAWYRYGTKDSGEWIGASASAEGKIHLNAQTWSILSGGATPERAERAWESVKERLLTPYGPLLLAPAYTVPDASIGYVTRYAPGSRENGGVYMHAATWALMTACKRRDAAAAGKIWKSISPPTRGQSSEAYYAEPYVLPGNVDGPLSDKPGRAGWTWYTGSAAWLNRVSLEWMLGVRPVWGGLEIDPCPPADLGQVRVKRTWRGREVVVRFDAGAFRAEVRPTLRVNGQTIEGNVIPESLVSTMGKVGGTGGAGKSNGTTTPVHEHRAHGAIEVEVSWGARPVVLTGAGSGASTERSVP